MRFPTFGLRLFESYMPELYFYGQPKNLMHVGDNWNMLNHESHVDNHVAAIYSMFNQIVDPYHDNSTTIPDYHEHNESLDLAMPWLSVGQMVAGYGEGLSTSQETVCAGHIIVPAPFTVIIPVVRADDSSNGIAVQIDYYESSNMASVKASQSVGFYSSTNVPQNFPVMDVSEFAQDSDGFRNIFVVVKCRMLASTGTFYEIEFRLPRTDGLDS